MKPTLLSLVLAALAVATPLCAANSRCPEDALICKDGSVVSRVGDDCKFALCPEDKDKHESKSFTFSNA